LEGETTYSSHEYSSAWASDCSVVSGLLTTVVWLCWLWGDTKFWKISDLFPKQWHRELHPSCQGLLLPPASQLGMGLPASWWEQSTWCHSSALHQWLPGVAWRGGGGKQPAQKTTSSPKWTITERDYLG